MIESTTTEVCKYDDLETRRQAIEFAVNIESGKGADTVLATAKMLYDWMTAEE